MKQSAVEWLEEQYTKQITFLHREDFEQAKEMEKQQIISAIYNSQRTDFYVKYYDAEQYYNEIYKNEKI